MKPRLHCSCALKCHPELNIRMIHSVNHCKGWKRFCLHSVTMGPSQDQKLLFVSEHLLISCSSSVTLETVKPWFVCLCFTFSHKFRQCHSIENYHQSLSPMLCRVIFEKTKGPLSGLPTTPVFSKQALVGLESRRHSQTVVVAAYIKCPESKSNEG